MSQKKKKIWRLVFWLIIGLLVLWYIKFADHYPRQITLQAKPDFWGVTYSVKMADSLGLDWREAYLAVLDDLQAKNIRIPIYWDQIEKNKGEYDFSNYDYIFDEGDRRGVDFVANIGYRLPRWPECHAPQWLDQKNDSEREQATLDMLAVIINHYKDRPAIKVWQIENEPLFNLFGECPKGHLDFLQKEIALARNLDKTRPILVSVSGELSTWRQEARAGDYLGTTMYRVVWNKWFGYFRYPWPDWFYRFKAWLVGVSKDHLLISELQVEPWVPKGNLASFPDQEAAKSLSLEQLKANLQYAINTDLPQAYLWGVEWWYVKYKQGDTIYWTFMKSVLANNK
ncbi:MAG: glycoside hydrolase family 2 TIM barrel-domain containing protein [Patescibacteria group bacterium]